MGTRGRVGGTRVRSRSAAQVRDLRSKINSRHAAELTRFAAVHGDRSDVRACTVLSIDELGFDLGVIGESEATTERVGLKVPPQNAEEAISAFTKLFQEAYARQNGWIAVRASPERARSVIPSSVKSWRSQESAA